MLTDSKTLQKRKKEKKLKPWQARKVFLLIMSCCISWCLNFQGLLGKKGKKSEERWKGKDGEGSWRRQRDGREQQSRGGASCQVPLPRVGTGPCQSRRFITHTSLTAQTDLKALWHVPRVIRDGFLPASIMERLLTKIKSECLNSF